MITTVSTSGGAQVAVFALPTRTMYSGLRVSWLSYLGAAEQRRAAELPTPVGAVSYLSTQALMRSMAACRLGGCLQCGAHDRSGSYLHPMQ